MKSDSKRVAGSAPPPCSRVRSFGWGVINCGILVLPSIRSTRKQCQDDFADRAKAPWAALRRSGNYRCMKVWMSYRENARHLAAWPEDTENKQ